jgi:hypothetical protein
VGVVANKTIQPETNVALTKVSSADKGASTKVESSITLTDQGSFKFKRMPSRIRTSDDGKLFFQAEGKEV